MIRKLKSSIPFHPLDHFTTISAHTRNLMSMNDSEEECSKFYLSAYDDDDNDTHDDIQQQGSRDEISIISQGVGVASFDEGNLVETVSMDYGIRRNTCKQFCCSCCLPSLTR